MRVPLLPAVNTSLVAEIEARTGFDAQVGGFLVGVDVVVDVFAADLPVGTVIAQALEQDLSRPVITANQASLWHCLKLSGIEPNVHGYGRLLASDKEHNHG